MEQNLLHGVNKIYSWNNIQSGGRYHYFFQVLFAVEINIILFSTMMLFSSKISVFSTVLHFVMLMIIPTSECNHLLIKRSTWF